MHRLYKISFHLAAFLSLAISVFAVDLWSQAKPLSPNYSYFTSSNAALTTNRFGVYAFGNEIIAEWTHRSANDRAGLEDAIDKVGRWRETPGFQKRGIYFMGYDWTHPATLMQRLGFFFFNDQQPPFYYFLQRAAVLYLPAWFVLLVCAILPITDAMLLIRAFIRSRNKSPGHCPICGYDLRATPDRCPECGIKTAQSVQP